MSDIELRRAIAGALGAFGNQSLKDASLGFFKALGYESSKRLALQPNTGAGFRVMFDREGALDAGRAMLDDWREVEFLFQLTSSEIATLSSGQLAFATGEEFEGKQIDSFVFVAINLQGSQYSRNALAEATREINRLFTMPAILLFRHGAHLSIAIIGRRINRRDSTRDVLEKVTLIKDVRIGSPHRAHIEILAGIAFTQLTSDQAIHNFVQLYDAWRKALDIAALNKRFYNELAYWFEWAAATVEFPRGANIDEHKQTTEAEKRKARNAVSVIRLITRLIFVWFIKEKGLVPEPLFTVEGVGKLLKAVPPEGSQYYKAILQNLFFATLNTEMGVNEQGRPRRRFAADGKGGPDEGYLIHNLYRFREEFNDSAEALKLLADIPLMNGGLFECLDREVTADEIKKQPELKNVVVKEGNQWVRRIDGFSRRPENPLSVPNALFFAPEHDAGTILNQAYGTEGKRYPKVRGLLEILAAYKFTIDENTPVEEEVALDPELLGKVFENLLASVNPDTQTTARKQSGSFYTPREVVNYMVDESLVAYFASRLRIGGNALKPAPTKASSGILDLGTGAGDLDFGNAISVKAATESALVQTDPLEEKLRELVSYSAAPHSFTSEQTAKLVAAIDQIKVLDPACGSGAFPMGVLHKLVHVLGKLDPGNQQWKDKQITRVRAAMREVEQIDDLERREQILEGLRGELESINEAFDRNELDYGRKLYLIENCIYGVDIQPIAVQIAKLRFFISLVVSQRVDDGHENRGVKPLPNLETKFVAGNSLLAIKGPPQQSLRNLEIDELEIELKRVRQRHFTARKFKDKQRYRHEDSQLREMLARLFEEDGFGAETARLLASWDPYDQNAAAGFFDAEWMFGISQGFDIVIGNPPYVSALDFSRIYGSEMRQLLNAQYESATGTYDLFVLFIERGLQLCKNFGHLGFITPNKYLAAKYAAGLRAWLLNQASLLKLLDVSAIRVFEEASVYPVVSLFRKDQGTTPSIAVSLPLIKGIEYFALEQYAISQVPSQWLRLLPENIWGFLLSPNNKMLPKITKGTVPLAQLGEINATSTAAEADAYGSHLTSTRSSDSLKVINTGTIDRYSVLWGKKELVNGGQKFQTPYLSPSRAGVNKRRLAMYIAPKLIFAKMAKTCEVVVDSRGEYASINTNCFYSPRQDISLKYIGGLCNSRMFMFLYDLFFGALRMSGGYYQFQAPQLRVMPIPPTDAKQQSAVENLVDEILKLKQKNSDIDTSNQEAQIDNLIYSLYGLSLEEIEIVKSATGGPVPEVPLSI